MHEFVTNDTARAALAALTHYRTCLRIASYSLQISVRRRFVPEPDLSSLSAYASGFCRNRHIDSQKGMADARAAIELPLIGIKIAQRPQVARKPAVALQVLLDIARSQNAHEAHIANLVATAEAAELIARGAAVPLADATGGRYPTSLMGQKLRATIRRDYLARGRLPAGSSGEDAGKLIDIAFSQLVAERFRQSRTDFEIGLLGASVSALATSDPMDASNVEKVIRHELDGAPGDAPDTPNTPAVKLSTMTRLVSDLGMFDGEVDTLLAKAETVAADRGLRLVYLT